MSTDGYLVCRDCRWSLFLGKAISSGTQVDFYHRGGAEREHPWQRHELNQVLWKFLADHTSHQIRVLQEHEMSDEDWNAGTIGGDTDKDISFEEYLRGWGGLKEAASSREGFTTCPFCENQLLR